MNALKLWNNSILDTFFDSLETGFYNKTYHPKTDVVENEKDYSITIEVPGFNEKNLNVEVKDGYLFIKGEVENKKDEKDKEERYILKERSYARFERTFRLPDNVDGEKINAKLENGILHLKLEKKEEEKPKQIKIN